MGLSGHFLFPLAQNSIEPEEKYRAGRGSGNDVGNGLCQIDSKHLICQKQGQDKHTVCCPPWPRISFPLSEINPPPPDPSPGA